MATYDPNFNRVYVTVDRPDEAERVSKVLKDRLIRRDLDHPDEQGRICIPYRDEDADIAADGVRKVVGREFPGSEGWIRIEAVKGRQARD